MKSNFLSKTIGGAILGSSLLFGMVMAAGTTAQAQYQNQDDRYRNDQWRRDRDRRRDDRDWDQNRGWRSRNGDRPNDGYRNYGGSFELRQTALNAGYNEGMKEGRKHRRDYDRYYNFRDSSTYQRATKDYSSRLGDRYIYQQYFRDAFVNGYRAGLQGY